MNRSTMRVFGFGALLCAFLCAPLAQAGSVTVGNPGSGSCLPFMCNMSGTNSGESIDYQQVYAASAFTGGATTITAITWYYDSAGGGTSTVLGGSYAFYWGYASSLSLNSSNLPGNYISGSGPNSLGSVPVSPGGFNYGPTLTVSGFAPFSFDPSGGNLLLEVIVTNQDKVQYGDGGYNEMDPSGSVTTRAAIIPNYSNVADSSALVTTFTTLDSGIPEPASLVLLGSGLLSLAGVLRRRRNL